jgi:DNA-binding NarL/FixJ family response regulator
MVRLFFDPFSKHSLERHTMTPRKHQEITEKEEQIIVLTRNGLTNRQIAETLNISVNTVKHYLTIIYQKGSLKKRRSKN